MIRVMLLVGPWNNLRGNKWLAFRTSNNELTVITIYHTNKHTNESTNDPQMNGVFRARVLATQISG